VGFEGFVRLVIAHARAYNHAIAAAPADHDGHGSQGVAPPSFLQVLPPRGAAGSQHQNRSVSGNRTLQAGPPWPRLNFRVAHHQFAVVKRWANNPDLPKIIFLMPAGWPAKRLVCAMTL
jgi:hypothetical protein